MVLGVPGMRGGAGTVALKRGQTGRRENVHLSRKKEMKGTEKQNKEVFQAAAVISSQDSFSHTVDTNVPLPLWNRKKTAYNSSQTHFTRKRDRDREIITKNRWKSTK
uniref:Uncharacterized protein n=1 Tax=Micrurus corallinus TaxID=54390 RepID=A0A2D4FL90_MICCO